MAPEMSASRGEALEQRVADLFRRAGWKVRRLPSAGNLRAHLLARRGNHSYVVEVKSAPEGRRDRLLPLLAQAILQARAFAQRSQEPAAPLAIVGAKRVSEGLARDLDRFVQEYAPDSAVGLVDMEGFQWFRGPGLDSSMNAGRGRAEQRLRVRAPDAAVSHLFSDLNQWMLKVLLAPGIPSELLNAPRGEYRNASQLAAASNVSVMSAFRFVRQLRTEGFLDESSSILSLVRLEELLRRWQAERPRPARDVPMRWILRGDPARQLHDALRAQAAESAAPSARSRRAKRRRSACALASSQRPTHSVSGLCTASHRSSTLNDWSPFCSSDSASRWRPQRLLRTSTSESRQRGNPCSAGRYAAVAFQCPMCCKSGWMREPTRPAAMNRLR